jgi:hypothetical protein
MVSPTEHHQPIWVSGPFALPNLNLHMVNMQQNKRTSNPWVVGLLGITDHIYIYIYITDTVTKSSATVVTNSSDTLIKFFDTDLIKSSDPV